MTLRHDFLSRWFAICGWVALSACAEAEDFKDTNKPRTFFDTCEPGPAAACAPPFSCLEVSGLSGSGYCTQVCAQTADCPVWTATGQCAGHFQSQCADGVCQYGCE